MERVTLEAFFIEGADKLPDDKLYKPAETQHLTQALFRSLMKSSTSTVPVNRFVKQQAKKDVSSEERF